MDGFEFEKEINEDTKVQWARRLTGSRIYPAILVVSPGSITKKEDLFAVGYQRRVARSTGELVGIADMIRTVQEAAFSNEWNSELDGMALYLFSKYELNETNYEPAAKNLGVLDKFISMYLKDNY